MAGHGHDNHSSHGHESENEIVLHQENLVPTFLVALLFAIVALVGLAQAGGGKFVASFGTEAYQKVQSQIPKFEAKKEEHKETKKLEMTEPTATYKPQEVAPEGKKEEHKD